MNRTSPLTILCLICVLLNNTAVANESTGNPSQHLSGVFGIIVETLDGKPKFEVGNIVPSLEG